MWAQVWYPTSIQPTTRQQFLQPFNLKPYNLTTYKPTLIVYPTTILLLDRVLPLFEHCAVRVNWRVCEISLFVESILKKGGVLTLRHMTMLIDCTTLVVYDLKARSAIAAFWRHGLRLQHSAKCGSLLQRTVVCRSVMYTLCVRNVIVWSLVENAFNYMFTSISRMIAIYWWKNKMKSALKNTF